MLPPADGVTEYVAGLKSRMRSMTDGEFHEALEAFLDEVAPLASRDTDAVGGGEYGYGIVDAAGVPWSNEACVCGDRPPMDETVENLNDQSTWTKEESRRPHRVVRLIYVELEGPEESARLYAEAVARYAAEMADEP